MNHLDLSELAPHFDLLQTHVFGRYKTSHQRAFVPNLEIHRHSKNSVNSVSTIARVRTLSDRDDGRYRAAVERIADFQRMTDGLDLVVENWKQVEAEFAQVTSQISSSQLSIFDQDLSRRRRLQASVVNFLNAVRLYLDHRRTHLVRSFGKDSDQLRTFDNRRKELHSSVPEYAFVYELRNFVTHCGMPLQVMRSVQELVEVDGVEETRTTTIVGCDRDELIRLFKDWRHSEQTIMSQPSEFPILGKLAVMKDCIVAIETAVANVLLRDLWPECQFVTSILAEGCSHESIGLVMNLMPREPIEVGTTIQTVMPPLSLLVWLKLIIFTGDAPPGYRINQAALRWPVGPKIVLGEF